MRSGKRRHLPYILVALWFVFTASLAGWWYLFGVEQTERIVELEATKSPALQRHIKMLRWEGLTLLFSIVIGAGGMAYFIFREMRQADRLQLFFSTFTHELKTPLASVRLQAESLKEDLAGTEAARLVDRLISDTQRLTLQLENSLYLAEDGGLRMFRESKDFGEFIEALRPQWPDLTLAINGKAMVDADLRALECIVRNLLQNALLHGHASQVQFDITNGHNAKINLRVSDNGKGVSIPRATLGKLFGRHYPGSGNGIGLYLIRRLTERMGGKLSFPETKEEHGFIVDLELPGKLV